MSYYDNLNEESLKAQKIINDYLNTSQDYYIYLPFDFKPYQTR